MLSNRTRNYARLLASGLPLCACCIGLAGTLPPLPVSAQAKAEPAAPVAGAQKSDTGAHVSALGRRLCLAAGAGRLAVVRRLVAQGADVNAAQENGWTALMLAAAGAHAPVVRLLLDHGADPHRRSTRYNDVDALLLAAQAGDAASCRLLLSHGVNVDEADLDGDTVLMYAAGNTNIPPARAYRVSKYLLSRGADSQIKDRLGNTPLSVAQAAARIEPGLGAVVRLLEREKGGGYLTNSSGLGSSAVHRAGGR